ncbi:Cytochrome c oxidase subunit 3 [bacterium HR17]|uniref:Cytochrome c oxidase subunit 3 n=1 Tax=Candidatus Fervidibacter japonicus TaxID=2035412 RepID=A0A2H5XAQ4_9BACT|nr:Cytochrome c oxidase subunit 3 [bacterium HR17]
MVSARARTLHMAGEPNMVRTKPKGTTVNIDDPGNGDGWSGDGWAQGGEGLPIPTARLGLWLFLGAATMLFAAFSSAYLVRMPMSDWRSVPKPPILWLNTLVLIFSSVTVQWAWVSARKGKLDALRNGLLVTTMLGALFVAGQLTAWRQLVAAGVYLQTNPASSFFYLLTAMHGLHLLGGIVALMWATAKAWRAEYTPANHLGVELCAVYWHFLTLVWLWLLILLSLR